MPQEAEAQGATQPEWQPDFKYKFGDEELEIEEAYRQYIKDEESQRIIKEWALSQKEMPQLQSQLQDLSGYKERFDPIYHQMMDLAQKWEAKDLDGFFQGMGVDYKTIEGYVAEKLRYNQLPEEQRREYDERRQERSESYEMRRRNEQLEQQVYQANVQRLGFELDQTLSKPDVQQLSSVYDDIYGQGAFRQEVVQAGQAIHAMHGQDLPAGQIVQMVAQRVRPLVERLSQSGQQQGVPQQAPRVIKNPRGSSASPDRARPKSVDDLRKLAAEM